MTVETQKSDREGEESYPVVPRFHPVHRIPRIIYDGLASARLAMALLIIILLCCLAGVTIVRDKEAWETIFSTLWFNGILVLLVINVACCFFGRIWGRRITLASFGMILFHLSFVVLFLGIVYNSLFYFRAEIRLTEGETLPNDQETSYDRIYHGRLFRMSTLRGTTTLNRLHVGYRANGEDKRAAYEVTVEDQRSKRHSYIYLTNNLTFRGFTYYPNREGYSTLVVLTTAKGEELYGVHIPLQSLPLGEGKFLYTNGTKDGPRFLPFPPSDPKFALNVSFAPDRTNPRKGEIRYQISTPPGARSGGENTLIAEGSKPVGSSFPFGDYLLTTKEIRYWTVMDVRYEPGKPIILTSLWVAFAGVVITTLARIYRSSSRQGVSS